MMQIPTFALAVSLLIPIQAPTPATRVVAHIKWCQTNHPEVCREQEIVTADGHEPTMMECLRGGMSGLAKFTFEGIEWHTKGMRCEEESSDYLTWRNAKLREGR